MDKNLSLVHSPEHKNYRKMAQSHYGLSDEQMKGVHVHHNPSRANGGRNVPEHLYVYSPVNHDYVHGGDGFVLAGDSNRSARSRIGGISCFNQRKGAFSLEGEQKRKEARKNIPSHVLSSAGAKGANKTVELQIGLHDPKNKQRCIEGAIKANKKVMDLRLGIHNPDYINSEEHRINRKRVGKLNGERMSKKVMCVETGEVFDSCKIAQTKIGVKGCGVSKSARSGGLKLCGGYHWKFI